MMERGYVFSGTGIIKHENQMLCEVDEIFIHMYPEAIFLSIPQIPATPFLVKTFFDPAVPELEVIVKVGSFCYVVKDGKVNTATFNAKSGESFYVKQIEIISLAIEMIPPKKPYSLQKTVQDIQNES
jgi:hypothetical protein